MSDAGTQFELHVRFLHVPENLVGVPLAAEVVSANGAVQTVVLMVSENQPATAQVSAPGQYLVRAELPSGRWVAQVAEVLTNPATLAPAATLDLSLAAAIPAVSKPILPPKKQGFPNFTPLLWAQRMLTYQLSIPHVEFSSPPARTRLDFGWFQKWSLGGDDGIDLVLQPNAAANQDLDLPGNARLERHPGWMANRLDVRPLLAQVRTAQGEQALVVWPPAGESYPLNLQVEENQRNPDAPSLSAAVSSGDRMVDALFAYVGIGALASARAASPILIAKAETFLYEKNEDPVRACLAAYTLLSVGALPHPQWLANLANRFQFLPDGDIANAWYLLRTGVYDKARSYFQSALAKGLPMYTEGVRLLRNGLNFVAELFPNDSETKSAAVLANRLANVANLDSKLTCLKIGKHLRLNRS
jgi:hypothetical protein